MFMQSLSRHLVLLLTLACWGAAAQDFPAKAIRLVVPYPPGGGTDVTARLVATPAAAALGQSIIVDNRPGASGLVGTDLVAAAQPDGYTLLLFADANTIAPALYPQAKNDPVTGFVPIAQLAIGPLVIFAHPSVPVTSVNELIQYARTRSDGLSYASPGNGTAQHLAMERFKLEAKIKILHVPYKGGGQAITDVVGGQVPLGILGLSAALPHIRAGKIKAIAVTDAVRSSLLPDVPTVAEAAIPGFEAVQWFGIVAPARTPRPIVERLHAEFTKALRDPAVISRLQDLGLKPTPDKTAEEFATFIREDARRWPAIVQAVGVKLD